MNYMIAVLPKMCGFLLLVLIGFAASRTGIVKKEAMPSISGFLLKIALPALTISSDPGKSDHISDNGSIW